VPGQDVDRTACVGVISELSVLARPLGFGLQALCGVTLRGGHLAWSLAGSADRLLKTANVFAADVASTGQGDHRPPYVLHWISPYESDVWD
jgi:hypothetical protein